MADELVPLDILNDYSLAQPSPGPGFPPQAGNVPPIDILGEYQGTEAPSISDREYQQQMREAMGPVVGTADAVISGVRNAPKTLLEIITGKPLKQIANAANTAKAKWGVPSEEPNKLVGLKNAIGAEASAFGAGAVEAAPLATGTLATLLAGPASGLAATYGADKLLQAIGLREPTTAYEDIESNVSGIVGAGAIPAIAKLPKYRSGQQAFRDLASTPRPKLAREVGMLNPETVRSLDTGEIPRGTLSASEPLLMAALNPALKEAAGILKIKPEIALRELKDKHGYFNGIGSWAELARKIENDVGGALEANPEAPGVKVGRGRLGEEIGGYLNEIAQGQKALAPEGAVGISEAQRNGGVVSAKEFLDALDKEIKGEVSTGRPAALDYSKKLAAERIAKEQTFNLLGMFDDATKASKLKIEIPQGDGVSVKRSWRSSADDKFITPESLDSLLSKTPMTVDWIQKYKNMLGEQIDFAQLSGGVKEATETPFNAAAYRIAKKMEYDAADAYDATTGSETGKYLKDASDKFFYLKAIRDRVLQSDTRSQRALTNQAESRLTSAIRTGSGGGGSLWAKLAPTSQDPIGARGQFRNAMAAGGLEQGIDTFRNTLDPYSIREMPGSVLTPLSTPRIAGNLASFYAKNLISPAGIAARFAVNSGLAAKIPMINAGTSPTENAPAQLSSFNSAMEQPALSAPKVVLPRHYEEAVAYLPKEQLPIFEQAIQAGDQKQVTQMVQAGLSLKFMSLGNELNIGGNSEKIAREQKAISEKIHKLNQGDIFGAP